MKEHTINDFTPGKGTGWFKFANSFDTNLFDGKGIVTWGYIPVGHASFGLCGGMVYAAKDYHEAQMPLPQCPKLDLSSPLGNFIKERQVASVLNGTDLYTYALQTMCGSKVSDYHLCAAEWSKIKATIDADHPSPLGLILAKSYNPLEITKNHQVLAYGYKVIGEDEGEKALINYYDPRCPDRNDLQLEFSTNVAAAPIDTNDPSLGPVYAFFESRYSPETPPLLGEGGDYA